MVQRRTKFEAPTSRQEAVAAIEALDGLYEAEVAPRNSRRAADVRLNGCVVGREGIVGGSRQAEKGQRCRADCWDDQGTARLLTIPIGAGERAVREVPIRGLEDEVRCATSAMCLRG